MPLFDLTLSQNQPCLFPSSSTNVDPKIKEKAYSPLIPSEFYQGCPSYDWPHSVLFETVKGDSNATDYDTYKQNGVLSNFEKLPGVDTSIFKEVNHGIFGAYYSSWSPHCTSGDDGFYASPKDVPQIVDNIGSLRSLAIVLLVLQILVCILCFTNYILSFFKERKAKKCARKFGKWRLLLTFILVLLSFFCLFKLMSATNDKVVSYLAANDCSSDAVLNAQFDSADSYIGSVVVKNWISVVVLVIIILIDMFFGLMAACKKLFKKNKHKKHKHYYNINEPFLNRDVPPPGGFH